MWRGVAIVVVVLGLASCGGAHRPKQHDAVIAGGCGTTKLYRSAPPAWTAPAFSDSSGPTSGPFGVADHGNAVAIVFGYPLRAGHPTDPSNKVLWIMRLPRRGSPLIIQARPLHGGGPTIKARWPADSSPGEIYPSYVDVPSAGCWHLTLTWAGHTDSIDLGYRA